MKRLGRLTGWFRKRSLRTRLAMLTAAAVAVTIALAALACWFVVDGKLYGQVRDDLSRAPWDVFANSRTQAHQPLTLVGCDSTPQGAARNAETTALNLESPTGGPPSPAFQRPGGGSPWTTQLLSPAGTVCMPLFNTYKGVNVEQSDVRALGLDRHKAIYRSGSFADGTPAMVRLSNTTSTVTAFDSNGNATTTTSNFVLLTAVPVNAVQDSLDQLALILLGVAAAGVLLAGGAGLLVARSALKPVDHLTDAVEHIARTEEVGTTIPVHGDDEIARLSTSFNSMSTALANSRERQTRLIADAGHELRTPLTSLRTNVDLLIRSDETGRPLPPATRAKMLGNMKAQMQELTLLIGDLLQLSRPDSPKPGSNPAVVALHEVTQRAVERGKLRGPGLVFNVDIHPWYVHGDAAALERAVINLLDNAVKYSPPGGSIDVALQHGKLTVRDHGPGIPADELQYVFDRFWRSPSSRQLPGSGLGLSIVAQTVQETDGEVSLGPALDGGPGALATVRLPGQPDVPQ